MQAEDIDIEYVPRQRPSLAFIEIDGEGLVFDEDQRSWHHLNASALVVFSCCDGTGTVGEIARDISEIFGEDLESIQDSVLQTVQQFGRQGILDQIEPSTFDHGRSHTARSHSHDHDHGDVDVEQSPRFLGVPPSS